MRRSLYSTGHPAIITCLMAGVLLILTLPLAAASASPTGRVWAERGDAGAVPRQSQAVQGIGPVSTILGTVSRGDADMYRLCVTGGKSLSAATVRGTSVDTQLFLFDKSGHGVYANDDAPRTLRSRLPAQHRLTPQSGGKVYLAVSSYNNDPVSERGVIFPSEPFRAVVGPTGPGGQHTVTGWTGRSFDKGRYVIRLTGARACGGPVGVG